MSGNDQARVEASNSGSFSGVRIARAVVLFCAGIAIAFTATLHSDFAFDRAVLATSLALVAVVALVEWVQRRGAARGQTLVLAIAAAGGAIGAALATQPVVFAVIVAAWAIVNGVLEFVGGALGATAKSDANLLGAAGVLLALLVLVFREDPIATLGLFGAYCFVAAVFLGIAAFDGRKAPLSDPSAAN